VQLPLVDLFLSLILFPSVTFRIHPPLCAFHSRVIVLPLRALASFHCKRQKRDYAVGLSVLDSWSVAYPSKSLPLLKSQQGSFIIPPERNGGAPIAPRLNHLRQGSSADVTEFVIDSPLHGNSLDLCSEHPVN
jgi:hypothetical protein